jgi:hypothetical protein
MARDRSKLLLVVKGTYICLWLLLLGGLSTELVLVIDRSRSAAAAEVYQSENVFEAARKANEAATLWQVRGVRYRPGSSLTLDVAGIHHEIRINSLGFRSEEFEVPKPSGVTRVICIGGSTTVQGRTNEETYPAALQRRLRERYRERRIEVLNLGINGTGSGYWLSRKDELFGYQPDVIVQYSFVNDLFWDHLPEYAVRHPLRRGVNLSLLLARLFPLDARSLDRYFERTLRRKRALAREARQHGVAYVAGTFAAPDPDRCSAEFQAYLDRNVESWGAPIRLRLYRDYYRLLERHNTLQEAAIGRALRVAPVHRQLSDGSLFIDLCHMSPAGIERLGAAFAPSVSRLIEERTPQR